MFIDYLDIVSTLSHCRNNKDAAKYSGISYSKMAAMYNEAQNGKSAYYNLILLEYFKRVDKENEKKVMKEYEILGDINYEFLSKYLFPGAVLESFVESKVQWKRDIIAHFCTLNHHFFLRQLNVLERYIRCEYGEDITNPLQDISKLQNISTLRQVSHL